MSDVKVRALFRRDFDSHEWKTGMGEVFKEACFKGMFKPKHFQKTWLTLYDAGLTSSAGMFKDGKMVGAIGGILHECPFTALKTLQELMWYVKRDYRKVTASKVMVQEYEALAIAKGASKFLMPAVNEHVQRFLKKRGFTPSIPLYERILT